MSHTKEPWDTDGFSSVGATGSDQFNGGFFTAICEGPDKTDNARRIVACVNALAHVSTEQLESGELLHMGQAIKDLTKQRDTLLLICEELQESAEYWSEYFVPLGIVERLDAAIASVKGGA